MVLRHAVAGVVGLGRRRSRVTGVPGVTSTVLTGVLCTFLVVAVSGGGVPGGGVPGGGVSGGGEMSGERYQTVADEIDVVVDVEVDVDGAANSQPAWYEVLCDVMSVAQAVVVADEPGTGGTAGEGGTGSASDASASDEGGGSSRNTTSGVGGGAPLVVPVGRRDLPSPAAPSPAGTATAAPGVGAPAESAGTAARPATAVPTAGRSPSTELAEDEDGGAAPVASQAFERGAWEAPALTAMYVLVALLVGFVLAGPRLVRRLAVWPARGRGRLAAAMVAGAVRTDGRRGRPEPDSTRAKARAAQHSGPQPATGSDPGVSGATEQAGDAADRLPAVRVPPWISGK